MDKDTSTVPLYNPLPTDFTVTYDIDGNKQPQTFTIHAQEIEHFDPIVADHIKHHLAKAIVTKRGTSGSNWESEIVKATKEIEVSLD